MTKVKELKKIGEEYFVETPLISFHKPNKVKDYLQGLLDRDQILQVLITEENNQAFVATRVMLTNREMSGKTKEDLKLQLQGKAKGIFVRVLHKAEKEIVHKIVRKGNLDESKITKIHDVFDREKTK